METKKSEDLNEEKINMIRRFLLFTLRHADRRTDLTPEIWREKMLKLFECKVILVAKEINQDAGYDFHVGILEFLFFFPKRPSAKEQAALAHPTASPMS